MGHRVVDAIIEDGQLKYVGEKMPGGRLKVHLIYDTNEEMTVQRKAKDIVKRTAGIHPGIIAAAEARRLRHSWDRKTWKLKFIWIRQGRQRPLPRIKSNPFRPLG